MTLTRSCKPDAPTGVILCAGASRRMGEPKGLLRLDGTPLVRAHVEAFARFGLATVVVLGPRLADHLAVLPPGTRATWNPRWEETDMATSAWLALRDLDVVLVTPVDTPPPSPETLKALLATPGAAVPTWQGRPGHPVKLLPPHPLARLDARLAGAVHVPVEDPDCARNLNTPEAWAGWVAEKAKRP